jgi:hypothetical protein
MKVLTLLLTPLIFCSWDNCEQLDDGRYHVQYDLTNDGAYNLKIKKDEYVKYLISGDSINGTIKNISPCLIVMNPNITDVKILKPDTLTDLGKRMKSFGEPCIELGKRTGDTIYFRMTYSGNLHLTSNEGKFIKIKN